MRRSEGKGPAPLATTRGADCQCRSDPSRSSGRSAAQDDRDTFAARTLFAGVAAPLHPSVRRASRSRRGRRRASAGRRPSGDVREWLVRSTRAHLWAVHLASLPLHPSRFLTPAGDASQPEGLANRLMAVTHSALHAESAPIAGPVLLSLLGTGACQLGSARRGVESCEHLRKL